MFGLLRCLCRRHDWRRECYFPQADLCDTPNAPMVDRCRRCRAVRNKPSWIGA